MHSAGIFIKSFLPDLERVILLINSIEDYQQEQVPIIVSVPHDNVSDFSYSLGRKCNIISDESYIPQNASRMPGWRHQQICKLYFARICPWEYYVCLDSDFYFWSNFSINSFFSEANKSPLVLSRMSTRYTTSNMVLSQFICSASTAHMPVALKSELKWRSDNVINPYKCPSIANKSRLIQPAQRAHLIREVFNREGAQIFVMPGPILDRGVVNYFHEFCRSSFESEVWRVIDDYPWEYIWYSEFFIKYFPDRYSAIIPKFLHFATQEDLYHFENEFDGKEKSREVFLGAAMAARHLDRVKVNFS